MAQELKNVTPSGGGKVHKVVKYDPYTYQDVADDAHPNYGKIGRACEHEHNPYKQAWGWWGHWIKTDKPITCGNCLKNYWPDGRKRA